ncbi:hypothetical protein L226DRAFT_258541 [Lentinus tigrinus ALCF2SS1-7]|uniref:F-box domain-containing protein n=1 Tax=Lentinus tigrinus ALCF2SS1-6 TaxID=1328759 RepID=A0A5C2RUH0_9APHY|nr:hypothetical protein L227DRAFT_312542 [Lentinus tigrinus ALCF2SS1-6]RPD70172.1 hypothetical protein L226DRAFT_258541 [Lentinus tigrinus ALCF2SS1-7]
MLESLLTRYMFRRTKVKTPSPSPSSSGGQPSHNDANYPFDTTAAPGINALPAELLVTIFHILIDDLAREDAESRMYIQSKLALLPRERQELQSDDWQESRGGRLSWPRVLHLPHDVLAGRWFGGRKPTPRTATSSPSRRAHSAHAPPPATCPMPVPVWPISWVVVTWVCHRWRDVALSAATLWRTFAVGRHWTERLWLPVFLARVGDTSLDVHRRGGRTLPRFAQDAHTATNASFPPSQYFAEMLGLLSSTRFDRISF